MTTLIRQSFLIRSFCLRREIRATRAASMPLLLTLFAGPGRLATILVAIETFWLQLKQET